MSEPESFTPASRLITDSTRSPKSDPIKMRKPNPTALNNQSYTKEKQISVLLKKILAQK